MAAFVTISQPAERGGVCWEVNRKLSVKIKKPAADLVTFHGNPSAYLSVEVHTVSQKPISELSVQHPVLFLQTILHKHQPHYFLYNILTQEILFCNHMFDFMRDFPYTYEYLCNLVPCNSIIRFHIKKSLIEALTYAIMIYETRCIYEI